MIEQYRTLREKIAEGKKNPREVKVAVDLSALNQLKDYEQMRQEMDQQFPGSQAAISDIGEDLRNRTQKRIAGGLEESLFPEPPDPSFLQSLGQSAMGAPGHKGGLMGGVGSLMEAPGKGLAGGISSAISDTLSAPATTYGYRLDKMLNSGFKGLMDRIKAPDVAAERFITQAAGNMADKATDLLSDMTSKAVSGMSDLFVGSPARKALVEQLRREDPILAQMPEQELKDAYHSIVKFAPILAKDKNAVRSALRMAAQTEGGLSYHVIKGLAEAETAVNKTRITE